MSARRIAWGAAAAALYLAAAVAGGRGGAPLVPVFDGLAPPAPYRWVNPPEGLEEGNLEPLAGEVTLPLEEGGAFGVVTDDGQAQFTAIADAVVIPEGEDMVELSMEPLDPASLGPPPGGSRFDGNAYRFEAGYPTAGGDLEFTRSSPATPGATDTGTMLLRYATHGDRMAAWTGEAWEPLETTRLQGTLQVWSSVVSLGTFVALAPGDAPLGTGGGGTGGGGIPWPLWIGIGAGVLAILAGLELFLRRRRKAAKEPARKAKGRSRHKG